MKIRSETQSYSARVLLFLGWSLLLLLLFWAFSPSQSIARVAPFSGRGPLFRWTALRTAFLALLLGSSIAASWLGFGLWAERLLRRERRAPLFWSRSVALGAGITSLILFCLGICGLLSTLTGWLLVAVGLSLCLLAPRPGSDREASPEPKCWWDSWTPLLAVLVLACLVLALPASLSPPLARDSLMYHLAVPRDFARAHGLVELPHNLMSYTPLSAEMQYLWAMLLGGTASAGAGARAAGFCGLLLALAAGVMLWEWGRYLKLGRFWSLVAVAGVATIPTCWAVATSAYIDMALALYISLTCFALGHWYTTLENSWLWQAGLYFGFALSSKLTTLALLLPFALVILWRLRREEASPIQRSVGLNSGLALVLAAIVALPWYLRNLWLSGSPFFPFFLNLWPAHVVDWDVSRSVLYNEWMLHYGHQPRNLLTDLLAPANLSLTGEMDSYSHYDGILGVYFLAGLPLLVAGRKYLSETLKAPLFMAAIFTCFWVFSSQQTRYLLPALPVLSLAIAACARGWLEPLQSGSRGSWLRHVVPLALLAVFASNEMLVVNLFRARDPLPVVAGQEPVNNYLDRHLSYFPFYEVINRDLPSTATLWLVNTRNDTFYLQRRGFSDNFFEAWTLTRLVESSETPADLGAQIRRLGVTHILIRYPTLLDAGRSPLVDPRRPAASRRNLQILSDFLFRYCQVLKRDPHYALLALTPAMS